MIFNIKKISSIKPIYIQLSNSISLKIGLHCNYKNYTSLNKTFFTVSIRTGLIKWNEIKILTNEFWFKKCKTIFSRYKIRYQFHVNSSVLCVLVCIYTPQPNHEHGNEMLLVLKQKMFVSRHGHTIFIFFIRFWCEKMTN